MNYGVYKKSYLQNRTLWQKVWFWFADGDLSNSVIIWFQTFKFKRNKVLVLDSPKSRELQKDKKTYDKIKVV